MSVFRYRYLKSMPFFDADGGAGAGGSGGEAGAGGNGGGTGDGAGAGGNGGAAGITLPKTADELTKLIQEETEKAVKASKEAWEKDYQTRLEAEKSEAVRLAKLSAEEREKELEKKKADELAQREAKIATQELTLKATDMLTSKNLPLEIRSLVIGKDEADTKARIEAFERVFQKAVEAAVNVKLAGSAQPGSGGKDDDEAALRASIRAGLNG